MSPIVTMCIWRTPVHGSWKKYESRTQHTVSILNSFQRHLHRVAIESSLLWTPKAASCVSVQGLLILGPSSAHLCRNTSSLQTRPCKSLLVEGFSSLIVSHELLHKQLTEEQSLLLCLGRERVTLDNLLMAVFHFNLALEGETQKKNEILP